MKILFLDESGDHNLNVLDANYPVFVLAGCVIVENYHRDVLTKKLAVLKENIFNSGKIILHYVDYTRNQNGFEKMKMKDFRERFYKEMNDFISEASFVLIACIIDKVGHKDKYDILAIDPYILSLEIIIERFVVSLQETGEKGLIIAESRGRQLDNELELAFLNLKINGTRFLRPKNISDTIEGFFIKKKEENIAGLQLVDSLVTPIGRRYLNRTNFYLNYNLIKKKFRKISCGKYKGYGLVILPKNKNG
jgi:hypothetical protein